MWNWRQLLMVFSISLPTVFNRTIGQKDLGELYDSLLGFGMMIELAALKCEGQYPMLKHVLAICKIFFMQLSLEIINLRCLQEMWSGPGAEWDEHLAIASLSSCCEKGGHLIVSD